MIFVHAKATKRFETSWGLYGVGMSPLATSRFEIYLLSIFMFFTLYESQLLWSVGFACL